MGLDRHHIDLLTAKIMAQILIATLAVSIGMMILLWLLSLYWDDASIVDAYWGLGFVVITWFTAVYYSGLNTQVALIVSMVTIWGLRLSCYLYFETQRKAKTDAT